MQFRQVRKASLGNIGTQFSFSCSKTISRCPVVLWWRFILFYSCCL